MQSPKKSSPRSDERSTKGAEGALAESGVRAIPPEARAALDAADAKEARAKVCPKVLAEHLPLVHQIVGPIARRVPANVQHDDLVLAGITGLADSLQKNGGDLGATFESYARTRIRGAILDELRSQDWLSRRTRDAVNAGVRNAEETNEDVSFVGLDELTLEDEQEFCRALEKDPEQLYAHKEVVDLLGLARESLLDRERDVLKKYYDEDKTFKDIGVELKISETRAFQLHARALSRLRAYFGKRSCRSHLHEVCPDSVRLEPEDHWSADVLNDEQPLRIA